MSFRRAFGNIFHGNDGTAGEKPPLLSIGTLQWGTTWLDEKMINTRGGCISESTARDIFQRASKANIQLWDTAEGYGGGTSEKRLGRLLKERHDKQAESAGTTATSEEEDGIIIMTKFLPVPWRYSHGCFESAVRASCKRLGVDRIPVYLMHSPVHWRSLEFWVEAAAICKRKGLIEALGLSNCNAEQVERAVKAGKEYGVDVVLNQVHYSLLCYNAPELQEMQEMCRKHDVAIVGFSPLGQGLLTNKMTEEAFEGNRPAKMMKIGWDDMGDLRTTLKQVSDEHNTTMAQVAIKWCANHDVIPLVGCRSLSQLEDSLGSISETWKLSDANMAALEKSHCVIPHSEAQNGAAASSSVCLVSSWLCAALWTCSGMEWSKAHPGSWLQMYTQRATKYK
eukprot:CAMPEP_0119546384 /NCGR_PEP_ID=MMETSP1352-20130426/834_1 /TAXON_ID=265584 /ORGANISM="Stauroneis constricta, Strain CCMP1120" /LENGTH=394 /DNA_ID=CAMNT_0007591087 /DNA_START=15 /DNA_END=1200 /DNA_ORIENTATION=+